LNGVFNTRQCNISIVVSIIAIQFRQFSTIATSPQTSFFTRDERCVNYVRRVRESTERGRFERAQYHVTLP